jgi:hypothetical protein
MDDHQIAVATLIVTALTVLERKETCGSWEL